MGSRWHSSQEKIIAITDYGVFNYRFCRERLDLAGEHISRQYYVM